MIFLSFYTRCVWKATGLCKLLEQLLSQRKKDCFLWCHNVLWFQKPNIGILWQFYVLFCTFFCQGSLFVTVLWKFDKIKNFWLSFSFVRRMSVEQQINLKFLVRLGKTPAEALKLLQEVYGDDTMSRTRFFEWQRRFKEGKEEVEDDHWSGRLFTTRTDEHVERVRQKGAERSPSYF